MIYVKKPGEPIYTPLHLVPPSLSGLARAVSEKFGVETSKIVEFLKRHPKTAVTVRMDDDMVKHYCNQDLFEIEIQSRADDPSLFVVTLVEMDQSTNVGMTQQHDPSSQQHYHHAMQQHSVPGTPHSHTPNGS